MATPAVVPAPDAATQQPVGTPAPEPQATPAPSAAPPSWNLKINDRVEYHSQDDAVKGYLELDKFRQKAQDFEQRIKQYGVDNLDAFFNNLDFTLDEYMKLKGGAPAATPPAQPEAPLTRAELDQILTKQREEQDYQARVNSAITFGHNTLKELMAAAKLPTDDKAFARVKSAIEDQIVAQSRDQQGRMLPGSVEDRYINGSEAERRAILDGEWKEFLRIVQAPAAAANADYAAQKTAALAAQPKTAPNGSAPSAPPKRVSESERMSNLRELLGRQ